LNVFVTSLSVNTPAYWPLPISAIRSTKWTLRLYLWIALKRAA